MFLRDDMPTRADARPGAGDERHASDYDPARGGWITPAREPEPTTPNTAPKGH